ncbi:cytochrome c6 PetJ [Calothrix rhizosoleniae]|uniref:cytochrome c6 PetJ n=1 Tax=Calothrix rhizosoleniae TaxID=888997 RepID=UPI000B49E2B4|nr:c-type cytochrome [Calothrix rhizosoleniae]
MYFVNKIVSVIFLTSIIILNTILIPTALATNITNGAKIFNANCAGCHINGSNIIRRGKNLKMRALKKYHMDSLDAIASIVTNGKNNMSAYKERLTEPEIQDVAAYVLQQAQHNWR